MRRDFVFSTPQCRPGGVEGWTKFDLPPTSTHREQDL